MIAPVRYNAEQAGHLVGKKKTWMLRQARTGAIAHHRLGRDIWWDDADIADILASAARPAKKPQTRKQTRPRPKTDKQTDAPQAESPKPLRLASADDIPQADPTGSRRYRPATA